MISPHLTRNSRQSRDSKIVSNINLVNLKIEKLFETLFLTVMTVKKNVCQFGNPRPRKRILRKNR